MYGSRLQLVGAVVVAVAVGLHAAPRDPFTLDRAAEQWVAQTLKKLTTDEKIGQLIVPTFESKICQHNCPGYQAC